jgi:cobalt-zinc-cadmium efflux system outer membrane protein
MSVPAAGQAPDVLPQPIAKYLARSEAVREALQNNPVLRTVRQQRGYAEAGVVMARTYPFNPSFTSITAHNSGPESAGITNRTFLEDYVTLEIELLHQGRYRRAAASAAANRIEWEILQQEMALAVAVIRAYNTALYRQKKLDVVDETIKLNREAYETVRRLTEIPGKLRAPDRLLALSALEDVRAQRGQAVTALAVARSDLRRLLGTLDDSFTLTGTLDVPLPTQDRNDLTQLALAKRPDLQAKFAAADEAEAALKLAQANRFGNPQIGPFFSFDPTEVASVGGRITMPLPVLNTKRGEILKARTDVAKVRSEAQELELRTTQEVQAALTRYAAAKSWADAYEREVVPNLRTTMQQMEKLFASNDPGADIMRVLSVQRAYLKATESLLDARFEVSAAEADLALAVAEPALALELASVPCSVSAGASSPIAGTPPQSIVPARGVLGPPSVAAEKRN